MMHEQQDQVNVQLGPNRRCFIKPDPTFRTTKSDGFLELLDSESEDYDSIDEPAWDSMDAQILTEESDEDTTEDESDDKDTDHEHGYCHGVRFVNSSEQVTESNVSRMSTPFDKVSDSQVDEQGSRNNSVQSESPTIKHSKEHLTLKSHHQSHIHSHHPSQLPVPNGIETDSNHSRNRSRHSKTGSPVLHHRKSKTLDRMSSTTELNKGGDNRHSTWMGSTADKPVDSVDPENGPEEISSPVLTIERDEDVNCEVMHKFWGVSCLPSNGYREKNVDNTMEPLPPNYWQKGFSFRQETPPTIIVSNDDLQNQCGCRDLLRNELIVENFGMLNQ